MSRTPDEVLNHHMAALSSGDIDAIMEDYADNAVLIMQNGVVSGTQELTKHFSTPSKILTADTKLEILYKKCIGNIAFLVWKAQNDNFNVPIASDTFVIENGKILSQTFVILVEKK